MLSEILYEVFFGIGKLVLKIIYGKRYKEEYASKKEKMDSKAISLTLLNVVWLVCLGIGLSQETEYPAIFLAVVVAYPLLIVAFAIIARRKRTGISE